MADPTNGWRSGRDPVQRWLRAVTVVVCLMVFAYLSIVRQTVDAVPTVALALGALLLLLGYESAIRIPGISRDTVAQPACREPGCERDAVRGGYCDPHRRAVE